MRQNRALIISNRDNLAKAVGKQDEMEKKVKANTEIVESLKLEVTDIKLNVAEVGQRFAVLNRDVTKVLSQNAQKKRTPMMVLEELALRGWTIFRMHRDKKLWGVFAQNDFKKLFDLEQRDLPKSKRSRQVQPGMLLKPKYGYSLIRLQVFEGGKTWREYREVELVQSARCNEAMDVPVRNLFALIRSAKTVGKGYDYQVVQGVVKELHLGKVHASTSPIMAIWQFQKRGSRESKQEAD